MYFIKPQFDHTWHYEFGTQRQVNDSEINQKNMTEKMKMFFKLSFFTRLKFLRNQITIFKILYIHCHLSRKIKKKLENHQNVDIPNL